MDLEWCQRVDRLIKILVATTAVQTASLFVLLLLILVRT
jgi:hypothetical protein